MCIESAGKQENRAGPLRFGELDQFDDGTCAEFVHLTPGTESGARNARHAAANDLSLLSMRGAVMSTGVTG